MLRQEWRKYRQRQIHKAIQEAREAAGLDKEAAATSSSASPIHTPQPASAEENAAGRNASQNKKTNQAHSALKSSPAKPKQILERLTEGAEEIREKLEMLDSRQQVLPLDDIEAAAPPPKKRSSGATESRAELVQRLLDPVLTLEEAAILLDVCPTTVRRYTNRGVLKCYRTPGNQRRFRLSEILSFMERRQRGQE